MANYQTLQFLDFYCAIMTLWVTAIILANVPIKWISSYHLGGSAFFVFLLRNNVVGFLTFVVPAFCSMALLLAYWVSVCLWNPKVWIYHFFIGA